MSAFVVDKPHIDAMVRAGLTYPHHELRWYPEGPPFRDARQLDHTTASRVGQMLVDENVASVAYRYDDADDLPGPIARYYTEPYSYPVMGTGRVPTAVEALKLVDCYEYQSCEHPGWLSSEAKQFCEVLRSALIGALPGYEDAPWEWRETVASPEPVRDESPADEPQDTTDYTDRNEAIKAIRTALKQRSGKAWSVTGGRGTAWGWITIEAPPRRRVDEYYTSETDCAELAQLLGLEHVHCQGVSIPASGDYRREYVARAQGETPAVHGTPYWD